MLDGELDAASVRRVMVHSDLCPSCRRFLDSIRSLARTHRDLHTCLTADGDAMVEMHVGADGRHKVTLQAAALRRQLTENRRQLARIFYELGRGFVLMGLSPSFSRVVAREPVPIPDMFQRGRNLIDEVSRLRDGPGVASAPAEAQVGSDWGAEWVRARELFGTGRLGTPGENLAKGKELLGEALQLCPDFHDARIYLGHAHQLAGELASARDQFRAVLDDADDVCTRAFAQFNLGNVYLDAGELQLAAECFRELVDAGAVRERPMFGLIYFNLALTYGMQERFDECAAWLARLYAEMPHKRRMIADEFRSRAQFLGFLERHPGVYDSFSERFPCWFPKKEAC